MKIRTDDIPEEGRILEFSGDSDILSEALLGLPIPPGIKIDPFIKGRLQILADSDDLFMIGHVHASVQLICSRCLTEFSWDAKPDLSLIFRHREGPDAELEDADGDLTFFEGKEIDAGEAIVQEILLSLPMKALCREDCPGLCPQCGAMKDSPDCRCSNQDRVDPRWAALEELKKRISP